MTEQEQLEKLTRETARLLLALARASWPGRGAHIMSRALLLEEEQNIPMIGVDFFESDQWGIAWKVGIGISCDKFIDGHWEYIKYDQDDFSPIDEMNKSE